MAKKSAPVNAGETTLFENTTMGIDLFIPVAKDPMEAYGRDIVIKGFYTWLCHQGWNVSFRKAFVKKLQEVTGVERRQMVKNGVPQVRKNKEGEVPVLESEQDYANWLLAEGTVSQEDYNSYGSEVAATVPAALPGSGESSRKPNKDCYEAARAYLAQIKNGQLTEDDLVSGYNARNYPSFADLGGTLDEDTLAKMVQIDEARKEKARAAKKAAGFGAE